MIKIKALIEKATDLGEGIISAVVASSSLDRHGEILDIKGLSVKEYLKNPVVLWAHDYAQPPIGKTLSLKKTIDGKLEAKIQFAINENSFAHTIYKLYKGGFMKAFSIGFIPLEMDGNTYTKSEMIEHSAVPVPANSDALALAVSKGLIGESELVLVSEKKKGVIMNLKDILAKKPADLSAEELAFLVDHKSELTSAQKFVFKSALPADEEKPAEEDKVEGLTAEVEKLTKAVDSIVERKSINVASKAKDTSKEAIFKTWYKGLVTKDYSEYLNIIGKDAMNTTDDGAVLPPEEFIAEVSRLEEEYGIAARYANVYRTTRPTLRGIKGGEDVEFVKTSEGSAKPSKKISYSQYELSFLKYAAYIPVTDELLEDSAVNLWNDMIGRFARAAAKREDELVFTEADVVDDVYGIVNAPGVATLSVGDEIADITADHLNQMLYAVPTPSMTNGRFYLHRTVLGAIQRLKGTDGNYIWSPGMNGGVSGTIWGFPYSLTEVLPALSEIEGDTPFMVFGDLKNTTLGIRVPMTTQFFNTGVVTDPDDDRVTLNLLTQDIQVVRARLRMNQVHVHPEAYSVLTTGNLS